MNRLPTLSAIREAVKMDPCVYFLEAIPVPESAGKRLVKVGISSQLNNRLSQIRQATPLEINVLATINHELARDIEMQWHDTLAKRHVRGEWFLLDDKHVQTIQNWCKDNAD